MRELLAVIAILLIGGVSLIFADLMTADDRGGEEISDE
jgi:Flp pilus assembly pilin Flp